MSELWYPQINYNLCTECLVCYEFCQHQVFSLEEEQHPIVTQPENCVTKCHGCEKQCPSDAIAYVDKTGSTRRIIL